MTSSDVPVKPSWTVDEDTRGRWTVHEDGDGNAWPAYTDADWWVGTLVDLGDAAAGRKVVRNEDRLHAAEAALVALIEECAALRVSQDTPERLQAMVANDVWKAIEQGATVATSKQGRWIEFSRTDDVIANGWKDALKGHYHDVVARIVEPPSPVTERVPWWGALRDERSVVVQNFPPSPAKSAEHRGAQITTEMGWCASVDADDETVEVLVESGDTTTEETKA